MTTVVVSSSQKSSQLTGSRLVSAIELGEASARGAAEGFVLDFATWAEAHAATVERAYRRARSASGFDQGEYRRWRQPKNADTAWSSRVLQWVRYTLAGPWFVPPAIVEQVCALVALLMEDSDVLVGVELRLIRQSDCALVVAAVCDAQEDAGRERTRAVGEFIVGGPGDLLEPCDVVRPW
jgi:hypothetical protein